MTEQQKELVQQSFEQVIPISDSVALEFYETLFSLSPETRPLFKADISEQAGKLMELLTYAISALDDLDELVPALEDLARRHVHYGVKAAHYDLVGAALLATLARNLGEEFSPEVRDAWVAVYTLVAKTMLNAVA